MRIFFVIFFFINILIGLGFLVIIALVIFSFISGYNRLGKQKALLQKAWHDIDVQLKRRHDLVSNLIKTVKGYKITEKDVLENVTKMRAASMKIKEIEKTAEAEEGLTQALKSLFDVSENYPELKADENFLSLRQELSAIENDIQLASRYYNETAQNYNILVNSFPTNVLAGVMNLEIAPYFEIETTEE